MDEYLKLGQAILDFNAEEKAVVKRVKMLERKIQIERKVCEPKEPTGKLFKRYVTEVKLLKEEFGWLFEILEEEKEAFKEYSKLADAEAQF